MKTLSKPLKDLRAMLSLPKTSGPYTRRMGTLATAVAALDVPAKPGARIDRAVSVLDGLEQQIQNDAKFAAGEKGHGGAWVKDVLEHVSTLKYDLIDARRALRKVRHSFDDLASILNRYGLK